MDRLPFFILFLGHLPFFFSFSAIVFHFFLGRLSSWVKIRLHTENQLPSLPVSALKDPGWGGWGGWGVEVELGCDNKTTIVAIRLAHLLYLRAA